MKQLKKILASGLSLIVMVAMVTVVQAGDKHKKSDKSKKMSGTIQTEQTTNGTDYTLQIQRDAKPNKTVDLTFTEEVTKELPDEGEQVTVRGHYNEENDQFQVTALNPQQGQQSQTQGQMQGQM